MNKKYALLSIVILTTSLLLMLGNKVSATVGGPKYISQIAYDASNKSIYYIENNYGGKGCPPVIHSVNIIENQDIQVKNCDEILQEYFRNYNEVSDQKYRQFISDFYGNLSYIGSVSLKKNNITVNVDAPSERVETGEKYWTEFRATIIQDNEEIAKINFRGCDKEQPHIFEGYRIPNSDVMAILVSNKGDCFEGGYVMESLYLVRGVKYYDTNIVRNFKEVSATEPNLGNMTIYVSSKDVTGYDDINASTNTQPTQTTPTRQKNLVVTAILFGTVIFFAGMLLGYLIGKNLQ